MKYRFRYYLTILCGLMLLSTCAKEQFPPGGPEDKTAPLVLTTLPENGSINVDPQTIIELQFSERVERNTVIKAIFISPPLSVEPRVSVKGSRVVIEPESALDSGVTYVLTLGATLSDLHRNPMSSSHSIAFSTGAKIDSATISGKVLVDLKAKKGMRVFAYFLNEYLFDSLFTVTPDYVTESGSDGKFSFTFMKPGEYLVLGVTDKDNDYKINTKSEQLAFPTMLARAKHLEEESIPLTLHVTNYDSSMSFRLLNCIGYGGFAELKYSNHLNPVSIIADSIAIVSSNGEIFHPDIAKVFADRVERINLWSDKLLADSSYTISTFGIKDINGEIINSDSLDCNLKLLGDDTKAPEIKERFPAQGQGLISAADTLSLTFSEPVEIGVDAALARVDSITTLPLYAIYNTGTEYYFVADSTLGGSGENKKYKFEIDLTKVQDRFGNSPEDSAYSFFYEIISIDSLGSLVGMIETDVDATLVINLEGRKHKLKYQFTQQGSAEFEWQLYPDSYLIKAYSDQNSNLAWDKGYLEPFSFAEPAWAIADTIKIRARFEQSGYHFKFINSVID